MNVDVEEELKPIMEDILTHRLTMITKQINSALKPAIHGVA
jgi:hypothetical protein